MSDFQVCVQEIICPFENRSKRMDTAALKSNVLWLVTFQVDSFSLDTLVPAFLPGTLTFSFLKLPTAVPVYYVKFLLIIRSSEFQDSFLNCTS